MTMLKHMLVLAVIWRLSNAAANMPVEDNPVKKSAMLAPMPGRSLLEDLTQDDNYDRARPAMHEAVSKMSSKNDRHTISDEDCKQHCTADSAGGKCDGAMTHETTAASKFECQVNCVTMNNQCIAIHSKNTTKADIDNHAALDLDDEKEFKRRQGQKAAEVKKNLMTKQQEVDNWKTRFKVEQSRESRSSKGFSFESQLNDLLERAQRVYKFLGLVPITDLGSNAHLATILTSSTQTAIQWDKFFVLPTWLTASIQADRVVAAQVAQDASSDTFYGLPTTDWRTEEDTDNDNYPNYAVKEVIPHFAELDERLGKLAHNTKVWSVLLDVLIYVMESAQWLATAKTGKQNTQESASWAPQVDKKSTETILLFEWTNDVAACQSSDAFEISGDSQWSYILPMQGQDPVSYKSKWLYAGPTPGFVFFEQKTGVESATYSHTLKLQHPGNAYAASDGQSAKSAMFLVQVELRKAETPAEDSGVTYYPAPGHLVGLGETYAWNKDMLYFHTAHDDTSSTTVYTVHSVGPVGTWHVKDRIDTLGVLVNSLVGFADTFASANSTSDLEAWKKKFDSYRAFVSMTSTLRQDAVSRLSREFLECRTDVQQLVKSTVSTDVETRGVHTVAVQNEEYMMQDHTYIFEKLQSDSNLKFTSARESVETSTELHLESLKQQLQSSASQFLATSKQECQSQVAALSLVAIEAMKKAGVESNTAIAEVSNLVKEAMAEVVSSSAELMKDEQSRSEALRDALKDAKAKADDAAQQATELRGKTLVALQSIIQSQDSEATSMNTISQMMETSITKVNSDAEESLQRATEHSDLISASLNTTSATAVSRSTASKISTDRLISEAESIIESHKLQIAGFDYNDALDKAFALELQTHHNNVHKIVGVPLTTNLEEVKIATEKSKSILHERIIEVTQQTTQQAEQALKKSKEEVAQARLTIAHKTHYVNVATLIDTYKTNNAVTVASSLKPLSDRVEVKEPAVATSVEERAVAKSAITVHTQSVKEPAVATSALNNKLPSLGEGLKVCYKGRGGVIWYDGMMTKGKGGQWTVSSVTDVGKNKDAEPPAGKRLSSNNCVLLAGIRVTSQIVDQPSDKGTLGDCTGGDPAITAHITKQVQDEDRLKDSVNKGYHGCQDFLDIMQKTTWTS